MSSDEITDYVEDGLPTNEATKNRRQRKRYYSSQLCAYFSNNSKDSQL